LETEEEPTAALAEEGVGGEAKDESGV